MQQSGKSGKGGKKLLKKELVEMVESIKSFLINDLVQEMKDNIKGAYLEYAEEKEVKSLDQFNKWLVQQEPRFIEIANKMLNIYREDNPIGYITELLTREADWVREFLYEETNWISEFLADS